MRTAFLFISIVFFYGAMSQEREGVSHNSWSDLLRAHVSPYGLVDYKGFKKDEALLDEYLKLLSDNPPKGWWHVEFQKAYWINAYNAFTIKLILQHYPVKSIRDINENGKDAWHIPFINIGNKLYTLDYIENTLLRGQFNDSRIHFAINCSAMSCPPLKNTAYSSESIEIELRLAARTFVSDKRYNILDKNHVQISEIFEWYKDDFLKEEKNIPAYLNKNSPHVEVSDNATINYIRYNWNLNER